MPDSGTRRASSVTTSASSSSLMGPPSQAMRSLSRSRCGLV